MIVIKDQYNVLCLGLSGSGKSTLLAQLVGETTDNIEPTNGFNIKTLPIKDTVLSIKELGGSGRVQHFWDYYFTDKNGLLFVVNAAADDDQLSLARETLKSVLSNASMKGRPCLVLGTHSDLPRAKSQQALHLHFQSIMQGHRWRVMTCSSFDKLQIVSALEALIDLIVNIG